MDVVAGMEIFVIALPHFLIICIFLIASPSFLK